jgi:hypothetical protein
MVNRDYRLKQTILAFLPAAYVTQKMKVKRLPAGSIVTILSKPDSVGFVDAVCEGKTFQVFVHDIEQHGERIQT